MSTKTSIKRIALVAVSALGFGLLSVMPAQAAFVAGAMTNGEVENLTIATSTTGRIGTATTALVTVDYTGDSEAGDDPTLRARFISRPAGSTATVAFTGVTADADSMTFTAANAAGNELLPAKAEVEVKAAVVDGDAATTVELTNVGFIPDVAGSYVVQVWLDLNEDGVLDANELDEEVDTETFVVSGAPTTITITKINGTAALSGTNGALVKIALTNSAGAAGLAAGETLVIDPSGTTANITVDGDDNSDTSEDGASVSLTSADFVGGVAWFNVDNDKAAAETVTLSISATGTDVASLVASTTISFVVADEAGASTSTTIASTSGVYDAGADNNGPFTVPLGASTVSFKHSVTYGTAAAATAAVGKYATYKVVDTTGRSTGSVAQGKIGLGYDGVITLAATTTATVLAGTFSVKTTSTTAANQYTVDTDDTDFVNDVVASEAVDMDNGTITASPDSITAAPGSTITFTITAKNQWGNELTSGTATMAIAGRNATTAATEVTKQLDAEGQATFTIKDAPAAGVTSTTDSVNITVLDAAGNDLTENGALSITWATQTVSTVVLTGGDTTAGVTAVTPTKKDIDAGIDGASTTTHGFSATVKDASGNLLTGTPVTWSISGTTGAAVLSTSVTTYTNASGVASTSVYGWVEGTYTVTATAGGVSGTGTITFAQTAAGEERTISATADGQVVKAKVVDRYGNAVPSVTVYATKTGEGYFGNGVTRTSTTTDSTGTAEFVISGGSAVVTVSTISYDALPGTYGSGQTSAPKGYVANSSSATTLATYALTAYTAGTTLVAEDGVGASFDAAGVSSATASVTITNTAAEAANAASDAAAEAIDAANAATDAANLAAEAADAATVAAEEARDAADAATAAVEELATQVATLMAALKAQITTLANTVAKIAKKVKA
jgi:hypothetical protein